MIKFKRPAGRCLKVLCFDKPIINELYGLIIQDPKIKKIRVILAMVKETPNAYAYQKLAEGIVYTVDGMVMFEFKKGYQFGPNQDMLVMFDCYIKTEQEEGRVLAHELKDRFKS